MQYLFRHIVVSLSLLLSVQLSAQNLHKTYFAIGLFTGAHSNMITFAFVKTTNGKFSGAEIVRKDRFVYTALGHWPHAANLSRENLFQKYGVDSCFLLTNESNKVMGYYAPVLEQLWKIRFYEHPYDYDQLGWSQGQYKPSIYQKEFLKKEYGVQNILTDYIYGDSLFKLLRDVQNPGWVSMYKTASRDTTTSQ